MEEIEEFERKHIEAVVAIHLSSLPTDFLPSLGKEFLSELFYPAVISSKYANGLVYVIDGKCIGFVIITYDSTKFLLEVIRSKPILFFSHLLRYTLSSLENFIFLIHLAKSLFTNKSEKGYAEIYVIAVEKSCRGKGIGNTLVNASILQARNQGRLGIRIKTLITNYEWVNYFIKRDWLKTLEFTIHKNTYVTLRKVF